MAGNWRTWLSLVHSSPRLSQCFRILCDQCLGISGVGLADPVGHQPSFLTGFPWKAHEPLFPGSIGSRDSLLGLCPMRGERSFFWGHLKACVPGVPTSRSLESGHFQLNTMKRESTSNLYLPLLPPSVWKKFLAWERLPIFRDSALNSPSPSELLRLSSPKGLGFSGKLLA